MWMCVCAQFQWEAFSKLSTTNLRLDFLVFSPLGDVGHINTSITYFTKCFHYLLRLIVVNIVF